MKLIVVTTSHTTDHPGWHKLKASLDRFGYEYQHILHPFSFGHQLPLVQRWAESYKGDATHLCYTDCFDTIAFGGPEEVVSKYCEYFEGKMLISGEKACFPLAHRAVEYPETKTPWKYVNGGGWLVEIEYFKHLCKKEKLTQQSHDQVWFMDAFLRNKEDIKIDNECVIFQTIAFSNQDEWREVNGRFENIGTGWKPIWFHGNGHTDLSWVYELAEKQLV